MFSSACKLESGLSKSQEEKKEERLLPSTDKNTKRILSAIKWKKKPFEFKEDKLDVTKLKNIAKKTNGATFHCSGNCTLLSMALLYNLKIGKTELKIKNTFPLHIGIDPELSKKILFSNSYTRVATFITNIDDLSSNILNLFNSTNERYSVILVHFKIARIDFGHELNAVVLGEKENPDIAFVDAWKTSKYIYTLSEIAERYKKALSFQLFYHQGAVKKIKNPETEAKQDATYFNMLLY